MTAVASPSSFQSGLPRNGWGNGNGTQINLNGMIVPPRKSVQRSNSSSSIASSTSTSTIQSPDSYKPVHLPSQEPTPKKRPARGVWPSSKAEPVSGLSNARPHSIPASSGPSAASAISALHSNPPVSSQQHMLPSQGQPNGATRSHGSQDAPAVLHLLPMNGTFERKTIQVPFFPDALRIGRQTNARTMPNPFNGYFDSKVLSRQHAEVWADRDGKILIRDVKSSNGTFVNGKRLSPENRDSDPNALKESDVLELGIDIVSEDQKTVVHHKVAARVEQAGIYGSPSSGQELNFAGLDPPPPGNHLPPAGQGFRNRSSSHTSVPSNSRFGVGPSNVGAYHSKWLQPVTVEQVVKRLNNELRQARLQSQDLHHTGSYVDAILSNEKPVPPPQLQKISSPAKTSDPKTRFIDPPAPPPSQPLPEKPDTSLRSKMADIPALQPLLRRSDTEKPRALPESNDDSPTKNEQGSHIVNLVEALTTAQREITSQGERLKSMEDALEQERQARSAAEERADKLKPEPHVVAGKGTEMVPSVLKEGQTEILPEAANPTSLQQRLELMRVEMDGMRQQVERYRQRAEAAEQESQRDRESLAEMVARLRRRDEAAEKRKAMRSKRRSERGQTGQESERSNLTEDPGQDSMDRDLDDDLEAADEQLNGHVDTVLSRQKTLKPEEFRGSPLSHGETPWSIEVLKGLSRSQLEDPANAVSTATAGSGRPAGSGGNMVIRRSAAQERLVQSAPYASMLGVVIVGVSLMAYLNGWSKGVSGER